MTDSYALELIGVGKRFGMLVANRDVTIRVRKAAVTAIVGENGAGKSTAMNIAFGLMQPDVGTVHIDGQAVRLSGPADAIARGLGMVHQHFKLVETFSVLENVVLGAEGGVLLKPALAAARRSLERLSAQYGLSVPMDARVSELSVGQRQRVEILKALARGARVLILDEPTAVLSPQEAQGLFDIIRTLTGKGVAVVLIAHKLREVLALADDIYVLRAGTVAGVRQAGQTDEHDLAELMIGHAVNAPLLTDRCADGPVVLSAAHLCLRDDRGRAILDDVSLDLPAGAIVGLAGVAGNGQSELLEVLAGLRAAESGSLSLDGVAVLHPHPQNMRALGVTFIPEDRHRFAMAGPFSAIETVVLGRQRDVAYADENGALDHAAARAACARLMGELDVRPPLPEWQAHALSGGNQQKLVVGRETAGEPRVLLAGQPTRGVDIGAAVRIHERLLALRAGGAAILLVSSDLDEILALADVIYVMGGGRIIGKVDARQTDARTLGLMMGQAWTGAPA